MRGAQILSDGSANKEELLGKMESLLTYLDPDFDDALTPEEIDMILLSLEQEISKDQNI